MISSFSFKFVSNDHEELIQEWIFRAEKQGMVKRLWAKDPTLWKKETREHAEIKNRLGWLSLTRLMKGKLPEIKAFAEEIRREGFLHVVLMGMGGSSLAPEVFGSVSGTKPGYPHVLILDSTDPLRVMDIEQQIDVSKTLFVVSSKSGGTIELLSFYKFFYEKVKAVNPENPGSQFAAITDPGSSLEAMAKEQSFRQVFLAPADVGGRFSALSYFGLVPAGLAGIDIDKALRGAEKMMDDSSLAVSAKDNSSLVLGIAMAVLAEVGHDKLTILAPDGLESFGDWAEQLVAESAGKEDMGIIPVVRESSENPEVFGKDRFFVALVPRNLKNLDEFESRLQVLSEAGHPVMTLYMKDSHDLGAEYFRWEMATAVACSLLKVNAFDQPDVQSAKEKTKVILKNFEESGKIEIHQSETALETFWENADTGNYAAVLAFLPDRMDLRTRLFELRDKIRNRTKLATTVGLGPRYLHSTGQLHKGGVNSGVFILITCEHPQDVQVPGEKYTFGQLELAQAMGDFEALEMKGRWLVHLRLSAPTLKALDEACVKIESALGSLQTS